MTEYTKDVLILKIYEYLDEGFFPSDVAEILDIPVEVVQELIDEVEGR